MNKHNDGGPAFPVVENAAHRIALVQAEKNAYEDGFERAVEGMSLRQYYKAHAPKEIPHWFWPDVDYKIPPAPKPNEIEDEDAREKARAWMLDPCYDLTDLVPQLEWFEDACIAHWNAINERDRLKTIERARQWPGHWADLMLDEDHNRGK